MAQPARSIKRDGPPYLEAKSGHGDGGTDPHKNENREEESPIIMAKRMFFIVPPSEVPTGHRPAPTFLPPTGTPPDRRGQLIGA